MDTESHKRLDGMLEELRTQLDIQLESGAGAGNRDVENIIGSIEALTSLSTRLTAEKDPGKETVLGCVVRTSVVVNPFGIHLGQVFEKETLDFDDPNRSMVVVKGPLFINIHKEVVDTMSGTRQEVFSAFLERVKTRKHQK